MIEKELEELGLTSGEARVYRALCVLHEATVGPIAKHSGVAYSKIYDVLERLIEKGLASFIVKGKTKYFQPAPPGRLYEYIEQKRKALDDSQRILDLVVPKLEKIGITEQESVRIFKGFKGLLSAYEIMLQNASEQEIVYYFYHHDERYSRRTIDFYINKPQFFELLEKAFKEKKVIWRGVYTGKGVDPKLKFMAVKKVYVPIPGNIDLTKDYVLITSWETEPQGILIQSKEVSRNLRRYFELLWKTTK
jgi:HTH-type transcriptional regulator, sugar sensing transcriptional regulator